MMICNLIMLLCCTMLSIEPQTAAPHQGIEKPTAESSSTDKSKASDKRVISQGVAVDLDVQPVSSLKRGRGELLEGDDVIFRFTVSDTTTGAPLTGIGPAAWMDLRRQNEVADCKTKIKAFVSGGLHARPKLDLNIYHVLALNHDATVSVIDPHFGYGGSKLFALVSLKSTGEDWALTPDSTKLVVSMPDSNQVAIVDTVTWKVITNIDTGPHPSRIAVQPDGRNVWVTYEGSDSNGADSGVTVITTEGLKVATQIPTGKGHHEIALSDDNHFAFVTNSDDATVSVIDIKGLKKIKDIKTGRKPSSIAFSSKGGVAYIVSEQDGTIVAVDGKRLKVVATVKAAPGLGQIKFAQNSRFGFIANPAENVVHILDASSNRIVQTADIEGGPDQISFSDTLAYVRSRGSEIVRMIPLAQADEQRRSVAVVDFPGGQHPFGKASRPSPADTIVKAPRENAVLVGNPADKSIYYYKEGMAAPMGTFSNYGREPRAVMVVNHSLKERLPGVYETTAKLGQAGLYDLAFLTDSPRIIHCFAVRVETNPDLSAVKHVGEVRIEPLIKDRVIRVGERTRLQFRLADPKTKDLKAGLRDLRVLIFLAPGIWQNRQMAKEVEKGLYEVEFEPPQSGFYYVYFESPSLDLKMDNAQYLVLQATDERSR